MIIGELQKNSSEKIILQTTEYRGHELLDLRVHFPEGSAWHPTKKGITFSKDKLQDIIELLKKAEQLIP